MSTLYISEYAEAAHFPTTLGVGAEPSHDQTPLTISSTSGASAAFQNNTRLVRIHTDAICSIVFGTAPTAVAQTQKRLAANQTEYFGVPMGMSYKVAVVTST